MYDLPYEFDELPALYLDNGIPVGFLSGMAGIEFDEDGSFDARWIVLYGPNGFEATIKSDDAYFSHVFRELAKDNGLAVAIEDQLLKLGVAPKSWNEPLTYRQVA